MRLIAPMMIVAGLTQASPTDTFMVSATITLGCLINNEVPPAGTQVGALGSLAFGTASALSQETRNVSLLASGSFTLSCTPGISLSMRIDGGLQPDGDRQLKRENGSETLAYQLYQDAASQNAIGIDQPTTLDTTTSPNDITLPIWGRLTLPGNRPADSYRDELVLTLEW
ncbi:spore coat U domain-containing protein [Vreelandella alkaliphila]|uniref:Csu type fimbrial protein n=1 Tax=Vreelandella alkaliphila TaxID=272774 RepID=UPI00232E57DD|nr:spore coat U domain-containing protein [Halomonas alkaliphila]